jgi:glycosyltransferase involved in cell wall biosynthesis
MGWFPVIPTGLNRYVYELIHQLIKTGDSLEFCGVGLPENLKLNSVQFTNLASPEQQLLWRLWSVYHRFSQHDFLHVDAINLHFALYSFPLLSHLPKHIPITFNFHGPWVLESQWEGANKGAILLKRWIERHVYDRCDRFIVLSKAFGTILHQEYSVPWEKIHIIPGGVNVHHFRANLSRQAARAQLNWPQDRIVLFTTRRLVHRMGLDQLIAALAQIKSQVPDVWLAIAGQGSLRNSLEQQVKELGLQHHLQFLGYLPDEHLPLAYQAADLTVVPSQGLEGFGLILVESLACGTPVLCTPVGGMPEIIEGFTPHLISESSDTAAIASRLREAVTGSLPLPSREDCREYAVKHFDWTTITQQVRQVLLS